MDHFSRHYMRWLLLLLLFQWTNCISFSRVTPENPYLFIGKPLVLNCTISGLGLGKVTGMYFTQNTTTIIPKQFTRALDVSTLQLNINITSPRDAGKYTCMMSSAKPPLFLTHISPPHVIGSQFVEVEYMVQAVKDIDCRVYNWEKMTCTWDLGTRYLNMNNMNVTLGWTISRSQYNCLHQTPTSCVWLMHEGAYSFQPDKTYRMQISIRNRRKNIIKKSKIFYIYSQSIVKPAKLHGIKCQPHNSSCTNLSWNHTHPLRCRVRYHSQWDASNIWKEKDVTRKSFLLCGLTPYTLYNFSISCLPQYSKKPFWSDKTRITFKTPSEVPERAPSIPGTYFRMAHQMNKHCSQVMLYWKKVPLQFQYGKPQGFLIQYRPKHENWKEVEVRQGLASAMICLRVDKAYELRLYARNDVNFSTGYSTLFIETVDGRPGQPTDFTAETLPIKGTSLFNLTLTWRKPSTDVKGIKSWRYLLMWCHKSSNIIYNCEDNPEWIHLPNSTLEHSMRVKGRFMKNVIFGIATKATFAESEPRLEDGSRNDYVKNISSGLVWAPCIFRKDWEPLEAPSRVNFGDITDKSLLINWEAMRCEESPTQIIEYLIHYCPVNSSKTCHGPPSVAHVRGNNTSYILTDLTPGLQYRVWLQAVSPAGKGPVSSPIFSMVINDKLTSEAIAAIIVSGIILICFIISCICAVRKIVPCRRKYNGIEIDCRIDNLPSLPDEPLYYDDEFDRKSLRCHLPSTKSYDSDDRCSVHTQNSPTAETPLITEPKKRNKTNKAPHSPKLSSRNQQQPTNMEKRTSATWSPRSSTNLEGIPTECYLDGSRSSPVTLSKPTRTRQMPVFDAADSQCPVGQQPSLLDSHYLPGDKDLGYVQGSIETIHPIKPPNDGYSYIIPDTTSYSGWTSHSSLDTPSNGNNAGTGSNGNLLYSLNGLSSTTIDSQGETVSSHCNSSPYHMSPPKQDLYFSSQSSLDNVGHQGNKVSLLDLQDLEEETEPVTTNGDFHFNNINNSVPGNAADVHPSAKVRRHMNDKLPKEPDAYSKFEPLSKLDEQILLNEGGDCIALKTYKTNANCKSDPALVKVRLPEERNGELPLMLNRFMAHHELIPYHSTVLPMQGNSEPPSYFVNDLTKHSEDINNDSSVYFISDRNTPCDNNSKKKGYSPKKKNSGANHSSFGNKGSKSNSVHSKKSDNPHSIRKRPERKTLSSSKEKSNELKTFAPARTTDASTLPEDLPAHYFMDPEITPDLPTTDL